MIITRVVGESAFRILLGQLHAAFVGKRDVDQRRRPAV